MSPENKGLRIYIYIRVFFQFKIKSCFNLLIFWSIFYYINWNKSYSKHYLY